MPTENLVQIFLTSVVQGITEFLPISSTGHISFLNELFSWNDTKLILMVSAHFGTLFAVIYYFWNDVKKYFFRGLISLFEKKKQSTLKFLQIFFIVLFPL